MPEVDILHSSSSESVATYFQFREQPPPSVLKNRHHNSQHMFHDPWRQLSASTGPSVALIMLLFKAKRELEHVPQ